MILIMGSPGAGKSTQARRLQSDGYTWISTGQLLRDRAEGKYKDMVERGELVPASYVQKMVIDEIERLGDQGELILDGFPRDFHESRWLYEDYGANIKALLALELDEDVAVNRLAKRGREDDTPEVVRDRFRVYHNETEEIVDYFAERGVAILKIDASGTENQVYDSIKEALGDIGQE